MNLPGWDRLKLVQRIVIQSFSTCVMKDLSCVPTVFLTTSKKFCVLALFPLCPIFSCLIHVIQMRTGCMLGQGGRQEG